MSAKHTQPDALWLAEAIEMQLIAERTGTNSCKDAAELRRQHELIVEMRDALEKAMPMLALLVLAGSSEADELGVTIGKLVTKLEGKQ